MTITIISEKENMVFPNTYYRTHDKNTSIRYGLGISFFFLFVVTLLNYFVGNVQVTIVLGTLTLTLFLITSLFNRNVLSQDEKKEDITIFSATNVLQQGNIEISLDNASITYNIFEQKVKDDEDFRVGIIKITNKDERILFRLEGPQCKDITEYLHTELGLPVVYDKNLRA